MSQNNDDRDRQNQGEGYQDANRTSGGDSMREGRASQGDEGGAGANQDMGSDLDDTMDEEMEDDDRDEDARVNPGQNRRRSIS